MRMRSQRRPLRGSAPHILHPTPEPQHPQTSESESQPVPQPTLPVHATARVAQQQLITSLQRTQGNAFTQRYMQHQQPSATIIRRDPDAAAPASTQDSIQADLTKQPPDYSKAVRQIDMMWMKMMLPYLRDLRGKGVDLDALIKNLAQPGVFVDRVRTAIEAVLGTFSAPSIAFLREKSRGVEKDQVELIRDFLGPDTFDARAKPLITEVTKSIQDRYRQALAQAQKDGQPPKSVATPAKPIPNAEVQEGLDQLTILSPLAAMQVRAVLTASADLLSGAGKADVTKATGLPDAYEWCGAFAQKSYGYDTTLITPGLIRGYFWSTQKLHDFFTYGSGYVTQKYIQVDDQWQTIQEYHQTRGSLRKWVSNAEISAGGDLDIRPGDIVTVWNHGARSLADGDHVQMVQSWDPSTKLLFTIAGNDGGYRISNKPPSEADAGVTDDKVKKLEAATGFTLDPNSSGGANVAVNLHDLSQEVAVTSPKIVVPPKPLKPTDETAEQKALREQKEQEFVAAVKKYLNEKKPGKTSFISGIGRPSLVDLEEHRYSAKAPKKP